MKKDVALLMKQLENFRQSCGELQVTIVPELLEKVLRHATVDENEKLMNLLGEIEASVSGLLGPTNRATFSAAMEFDQKCIGPEVELAEVLR